MTAYPWVVLKDDGTKDTSDAADTRIYESVKTLLMAAACHHAADPRRGSGFTSLIPWSDLHSATPMEDIAQASLRVTAPSDKKHFMYVNHRTASFMADNLNPADLYGRRALGAPTMELDGVRAILYQVGLPLLVMFDEGYLMQRTGKFRPFIPDGTAFIFDDRLTSFVTMHVAW